MNTLRELEQAATPAPWEERDALGPHGVERVVFSDAKTSRGDHVVASFGVFPDMSAPADARFVIALRNAAPTLLDLLDVVNTIEHHYGDELDAAYPYSWKLVRALLVDLGLREVVPDPA